MKPNEQNKIMAQQAEGLVEAWIADCKQYKDNPRDFTHLMNVYFIASQWFIKVVHNLGEDFGQIDITDFVRESDPTTRN